MSGLWLVVRLVVVRLVVVRLVVFLAGLAGIAVVHFCSSLWPPSGQSRASLHLRQSGGVPMQEPPKDRGKQEPRVWPPRVGPTYRTLQAPEGRHE